MEKQYIVYFGHFEMPDKNALAHRVKANAHLFSALGYDVVLIGYTRKLNESNIFRTEIQDEEWTNYSVEYPESIWQWVTDMCTFKKVLKVIRSRGIANCKAIVFTEIGVSNTKGLIHFARKYKIPLISDTVDWFIYNAKGSLKERYKAWSDRVMLNSLNPQIHNIMCISEFLTDIYRKKGCNVVTIPSLTYKEDSRFKNLPQYTPNYSIKLCYVGNPGYKGAKDRVDWCVRAFAEIDAPNTKLDIYGISSHDFEIQFPQYRHFIGRRNIEFHGLVSNDLCVSAISKCDYFTFAREDNQVTRSGFPTKFAESLAIGTPVITTPSGDVGKYLKNHENGFISSKCTFESYKEAMQTALNTTMNERIEIHNSEYMTRLDTKWWMHQVDDYLASLSAVRDTKRK